MQDDIASLLLFRRNNQRLIVILLEKNVKHINQQVRVAQDGWDRCFRCNELVSRNQISKDDRVSNQLCVLNLVHSLLAKDRVKLLIVDC